MIEIKTDTSLKDELKENYGICTLSNEEVNNIDEEAIVGRRIHSFGQELLALILIFALSTLLKEKSDFLAKLMEIFSKNSMSMICLGILVISILIIGVAVKLSIMIMENKEY